METNNKLREAMLSIRADILKRRSENVWYITDSDILEKINSALAEPVKNCDVGTPEEQSQRFDAFCDAHKYVGDDGANWCSRTCPCYNDINCGVNWAQMPYESEVTDGE